jgi:polysaccharide chain length determinant protein (PEP-CTERM system associated)
MENQFDYKKYLALIKKRKEVAIYIALIVMTCSVVLCYVLPEKYEANSTVFIEKNIISDLVKGIAVTPNYEDKIKVLTNSLTSRTLIKKVVNDLDLNLKKQNETQLNELVSEYQKNMDVKVKDKEGLFIISYRDANPRIARDFVNSLIQHYVEENISSKREASYSAKTFLSEQAKAFKDRIENAEAAITQFKQKNGMFLAGDSANMGSDLNSAQQRLDDMKVRRTQLEAQIAMLRKSNPDRFRLEAMEKRLGELRTEYTDNYPDVIRLKSDIEVLKEQLRGGLKGAGASPELAKLEYELKGVRASEAILASSAGKLQQVPAAKAELEKLERERDTQKNLYEQLVNREGQSEISKQLEVQDKSTTFRIIDPAVMPVKPVRPDRVSMILIGIVVGLAAGIGVALLLDMMDHGVKSMEPLKKIGLPILGTIPNIIIPEELLRQKKRDFKVYMASGIYLSLILCVLGYEVCTRYLL